MKNMIAVDDDVITILESGNLTGGKYFLPPGQLERKMYERVNSALTLMGGKWNRSAKAHVFDKDPAAVLENTIRTGQIFDSKKAFQFFPTPNVLAMRMADMAEIKQGDDVLEPEAGSGNIIYALQPAAALIGRLVAVELNPEHYEGLKRSYSAVADVIHGDFLQLQPDTLGLFDVILMNPPFAFQQDVRHIGHAVKFLKPGGRLVAICANGTKQRDALEMTMDTWEELPRGIFSDTIERCPRLVPRTDEGPASRGLHLQSRLR